MEVAEEKDRQRPFDPRDPEERRDAIENAGTDFTVMEGGSTAYAPVNLEPELRNLLDQEGISYDSEKDGDDLFLLFKSAKVESL